MYYRSVEVFTYRESKPRREFGDDPFENMAQEEQALNPDQLKSLQILPKRLMNITLFACDLDPFLIYKRIHKHCNHQKYSIYLRPELRAAPSSIDELRDKVRRPAQVVYSYLTIKFVIIFMVQIISCVFGRQYNSALEDLNRDGQGSNKNHTLRAAATTEQYDSSMRQLNAIGDLIGNPLSVSADLSALLISTLITAILYGFIVMPFKYRSTPMDAANL